MPERERKRYEKRKISRERNRERERRENGRKVAARARVARKGAGEEKERRERIYTPEVRIFPLSARTTN